MSRALVGIGWSSFASFGFVALASLSGCAQQPVVQAESLPLRRVVVYRNGVGYFERGGHVEEDRVTFKMKGAEVGDFLATLAVMERGGSSVRSAAFPIDVNDEVSPDEPTDDKSAPPKPPKTEEEKRGIKKVVLELDGKAHDLEVGYVAEAPVWRPSYRLVVHEGGEADLQAWGIVQNLSGEDWKDVSLSLVAGAPLAFAAQLGTPVIPPRPVVTDEGEVIAAVPHAETSLAQQSMPAPSPPPPPAAAPAASVAEADQDAEEDAPADKRKKGHARSVSRGPAGAPAPAPSAPAGARFELDTGAAAPPRMAPSAPRDLRSLAAVAVEAGTTRYDLPATVTVPDKSATMVMLLSKRVAGEAIFLFAPDGGVPDSAQHPFRVARFKNATGGALERGPIAVFEEGAFLGQGMVDPLPGDATTTVPFALERSLAIDVDRRYDELGERVAKIENGQLTIERDAQTLTKYRVRNGGDRNAKLLVKHPRIHGTRLVGAPAGTEDNVGTNSALVPTAVSARATTDLAVDERATTRRVEDWFSLVAENAMKAFLNDPKTPRDVVAKLGAAWSARQEIVKRQEARQKLAQEHASLEQQTEETRRNLKAIEKNKAADALRAKLTQRLGEMATRLDDLTKQIVEIDAKVAELRVQMKESLRDVKYVAPFASGSVTGDGA
jgi:hypothetical protein